MMGTTRHGRPSNWDVPVPYETNRMFPDACDDWNMPSFVSDNASDSADSDIRAELKGMLDTVPDAVLQRHSLAELFAEPKYVHVMRASQSTIPGDVGVESSVQSLDHAVNRSLRGSSSSQHRFSSVSAHLEELECAQPLELARLQILYSSQMRRVRDLEQTLQDSKESAR